MVGPIRLRLGSGSIGRARKSSSTLDALIVCLAVLFPTVDDAKAADDAYLDTLIAKAETLDLSAEPAWQALLHFRPDWLGSGHHSLVDSPGFFLAENGKTDRSAELTATLRSFFEPPSDDETRQHPQCAFVARYRWLNERLAFDSNRLSPAPCPEFEAWADAIDAEAATLIFPAAYLNNPASMFGHTLLRLDRPDQSEDTRLLSYAVNYGADTGADNGVLFAVLGLTGGYPGTYAVEPYYELVKRYSDIENRDIYEYQLDFSPDEVARMVAHLWEMRGHWSEYYFFDENCSYQLLFLLDVARPTLDLVGSFDLHVIPVDSVRAVLEKEGLFKRTVFRPSGQTRIVDGLAALTPTGRRLVRDLTAGTTLPDDHAAADLAPARRAALLELAETFVTHQMETGDLERDSAASRALTLLRARSEIDAASDLPSVQAPETRPDEGHKSARAGVGLGARDGRPFASFRLRPAYHGDLDPSGGYVPGAMIDFLAFDLRYYRGADTVTLEKFTGVGIRSMTPRNALIRPISWHLNAGLERMRVKNTDEEGALVAAFDGGAGISTSLGVREIWSATLDAGLTGGEDCDQTCSFNAGPALSLLWPMTDHATFLAGARYQLRFGEKTRNRYEVRLGQSLGFTQNLALKLEAALEDEGSGPEPTFLTSLDWYF
ncbi:MAG: Lnb N-terminal periplasmic domain-containing protein [Geminicoccaceae bacterium]